MALTALKLVDGPRELDLRSAGYTVGRVDVSFPAVRAVRQPRPGVNGEDDTTSLFGAASVAMDLVLDPLAFPLTTLQDALRAFCLPSARPYLHVDLDGQQRRIRLAIDQSTAPITDPLHRQVQMSWRAPDGVMEAAAEQIGTANAVPTVEAGRGYDLTFNRTYPTSSAVGSVTVSNDGNVPVSPLLRLYGPATDPRVENQSTGERLTFNGLTIAAGDWLEIDCREATIRLNGLTGQSRYARLDFATSTFLRLLPGTNTVRYYPVSFGTGARLEVRFRSAWL